MLLGQENKNPYGVFIFLQTKPLGVLGLAAVAIKTKPLGVLGLAAVASGDFPKENRVDPNLPNFALIFNDLHCSQRAFCLLTNANLTRRGKGGGEW